MKQFNSISIPHNIRLASGLIAVCVACLTVVATGIVVRDYLYNKTVRSDAAQLASSVRRFPEGARPLYSLDQLPQPDAVRIRSEQRHYSLRRLSTEFVICGPVYGQPFALHPATQRCWTYHDVGTEAGS